jgi:electron transport complex protein RnfC
MKLRLEKYESEIKAADVVLVLSCGVGVQTVAEYLEEKKSVRSLRHLPAAGIPGCDSIRVQM